VTGVRSNILPNLDLDISGGISFLSFQGIDDKIRLQGRAHIRYQLDGGWSTRLEAHHLSTVDLIGRDVLESTLRLAVEKRFGIATALEVGTFATRFVTDSGDSDPNLFGGVDVALRRQITRILQAGLSYRHYWNAGSFGSDDFHQNRVVLEFGFRL
jgi:hypothetical protein